MGIRQRREREKLEVREAILSAARDIALNEGWPAVTMRKVADRIEYSPPIIYEHFASKESMLTALMRYGFAQLLVAVQSAYDRAPDPESGLMSIAEAYWDFAWRFPELYQVMTGLGGVPFCAEGHAVEADAVFVYVLRVVQHILERMGATVSEQQAEDMVKLLWSTAHGLVALSMSKGMDVSLTHGKPLLRLAVQDALAAWRARK